ncbi:TFB3 [Hepatospora eriocheir]|uniref:TFB3 n=1 Tax=Hepatospora eriocheir TaxID=1081669 RepID=A0A1X0Q9Z5_9MICR|nr:TFB3 [Hepatospora eriocheir]
MTETELKCLICKIDSFIDPSIKLYISPCLHQVCEVCLFKVFDLTPSPCPQCGTLLRRINFMAPTFEDIAVEREIKVRRFLNKYYGKYLKMIDENFNPALNKEVDDWLEKYESYLFELLELPNEIEIDNKVQRDYNNNFFNLDLFEFIPEEAEIKKLKKVDKTVIENEPSFGVINCKNRFDEIELEIPRVLFKMVNEERFSKDIFLKYCEYHLNKILLD